MSITIIGGTPGAGKTSLARQLAARDGRGVHIEADVFFRFLVERRDPSRPDAASQNAIVVRAYSRAAAEYSAGGYSIYLDGVIGPWLIPEIVQITGACDYVLLHVSLESALRRVAGRVAQASAKPEVVRRMHEQFAGVLDRYAAHVIRADDMTVEDLAGRVGSNRLAGVYALHDPGSDGRGR